MTTDELRELLARHGWSVTKAVLANLDQREEILDTYERMRFEDATQPGTPWASVSTPGRQSIEREIDSLVRERQEAEREDDDDELRKLRRVFLERSLGATDDAPARRQRHGPDPHEIPRAKFMDAIGRLERGEALRRVAEATGLTRHDVAKIRDWRNGRGYELEPRPSSRGVILRKV